jgi:hypothetical protein
MSATGEFSSQFDYVFIFPMLEKDYSKQSPYAQHIADVFVNTGLELFSYLSVQNDELIILVKCPVSSSRCSMHVNMFIFKFLNLFINNLKDIVLENFADSIKFNLLLDEDRIEKVLAEGDSAHNIAPIFIKHDPSITTFRPHELSKYHISFSIKLR